MPDNNNPSLLDIAIGMSVIDAIGNGGDVVGRKSSFFDNTVDAWGMPRNKFNWLQVLQPQQTNVFKPTIGMDLRDFLGPQATLVSNTNSDFSNSSLGFLGGLGIFMGGLDQLIKEAGQYLAEKERLEARERGQNNPGGQTGPATGNTTTAGGGQPAVASADNNASATSTTRTAPRTSSTGNTGNKPPGGTDTPVVSTADKVPVRVAPGEQRPDNAVCYTLPPTGQQARGDVCYVDNTNTTIVPITRNTPPKMGR